MSVEHAIPSLVRYGLSPDADLIYRALSGDGPRTAAAVARDLGLPLRRVEVALDALEDRGAVARQLGSGAAAPRWSPHPVREALARLWVRTDEEARRQLQADNEAQRHAGHALLRSTLDEVVPLDDGMRYLPSRPLAQARLEELVSTFRYEYVGMNTEERFAPAIYDRGAEVEVGWANRGIETRMLGRPSQALKPDLLDGQPDHIRRMVQWRELPVVPMKMILLDRRVALVPVDPADFERGYLEISQRPILDSLLARFRRHWAEAQDYHELFPRPDLVLSGRERALVELLAAGCTDAVAARRMRISTRSVTSLVRGLMDRLSVENRFQLGLALGRLGAAHLPGVPVPPATGDVWT